MDQFSIRMLIGGLVARVREQTTAVFIALLTLSMPGQFLLAQEQTSTSRERHLAKLQCLACHAGPGRIVTDPETGETRSVTIVMGKFKRADHGKMECMDCHEKGFEQYPHVHMKTNICMDCHPRKDKDAADDRPYEFKRMQDEFRDTVHYTEYKNKKEKCCGLAPKNHVVIANDQDKKDNQLFTCEHCHDPHYFEATKRIEDPQRILKNDNGPCIKCHEPEASVILADPVKPTMAAVHKYLPHVDLHLKSTRCIDCHTTVTRKVAHDLPEGKKADQGCNSCHSIDTILAKRLYRYVENSNTLGFANATMLRDNYTMGAHRHRWADVATYVLVSLVVVLIGFHVSLRAIFYRRPKTRKKRKSHEDREARE